LTNPVGGVIGGAVGGVDAGGAGETAGDDKVLDELPGWSEAQAVKVAIGELSDGAMWRSLAWLWLGAVLVLWGLLLLAKIPQTIGRIGLGAAEAAIP
jgi:hypothetical protein